MPPPSQLSIATSSINRLLKEESSYRTELSGQQKRLATLEENASNRAEEEEEEVGNREFELRQQKQAIEETRAIFGPLRGRIEGAVERVEGMLDSGAPMDEKEVQAAKDAVGRAKGGST